MKGLILFGSLTYGQNVNKEKQEMEKTALEVFQAFGQGMMSGTGEWKNFISDSIKFEGPVDQVQGKEAFVKLNESFMPAIRGNKLHQAIEKDDWVITQIEIQVAAQSGKTITLDMTEWYEIKTGKIQSLKVYYDAEEFRKEMGMKQ